jgi:hypothetical protein
MLAQLATKSKRVEPNRATTEPSRASYRVTSILFSPRSKVVKQREKENFAFIESDNSPLLLPAQPRPAPLLTVAGLQPSPEPSNLMALLLYALPKRWRSRRPALHLHGCITCAVQIATPTKRMNGRWACRPLEGSAAVTDSCCLLRLIPSQSGSIRACDFLASAHAPFHFPFRVHR